MRRGRSNRRATSAYLRPPPGWWSVPFRLAGVVARYLAAACRPPVVTSLALAHGDPVAERGPQLHVEVSADPDDPGAGPERRSVLAGDLRWAAATRHEREAAYVEQTGRPRLSRAARRRSRGRSRGS
jgi:hypothetical protein